jgi:hypothetical protein
VLKFLPLRMALEHASSLLSLLLCHNNKLSRLDACPSAMHKEHAFLGCLWLRHQNHDGDFHGSEQTTVLPNGLPKQITNEGYI